MGVMCSLLGHDYGEADVERERAEQGDEVVRTAKRVERCRNCGHTRTISENKEVTALEAAAGVVREPDGTVVAAEDGPADAADDADSATTAEHQEIESAPDTAGGEERTDGHASLDIDRIYSGEPKTQDGPRRAPGEWPTEPESATTEADQPSAPGPSGHPRASWPDETDRSSAENGASVTHAGVSGRSAAGSSFACESCGFSAAVVDSPLRAGDICPGCRQDYLAWETRKG